MARKNGLREREGADALQAELDAQRRDRRGEQRSPSQRLCAERTRDQTSAGLRGVGGQVARFDRKRPRGDSRRLQSLPLGRPLRYRLREVHERDDPTGRFPGGLHGEVTGRGVTARPRGGRPAAIQVGHRTSSPYRLRPTPAPARAGLRCQAQLSLATRSVLLPNPR